MQGMGKEPQRQLYSEVWARESCLREQQLTHLNLELVQAARSTLIVR